MKTQHGFSLIELAIVLVIVTILIGGLAVPLSAQIEARRIGETRKIMEEAREAIFGYAMTHNTGGATPRPYLPCPSINDNGIENRFPTGECAASRGHFPWRDLGTGSQDAWGNRLRYEVTAPFSNASIGFSNASINMGTIQICNASGCVAPGNVAKNMAVALVSYGPNGWGGRTVNNTDMAAPTSADELENINANTTYVSRAPSKPGAAAGEFDDLVTWISTPVLISRVCPTPGGCL